jgi:hypothetical protein
MYRLDGTEFKKINGVWHIDGQPIVTVEKELKSKYWYRGLLTGWVIGLTPVLVMAVFR